MAMPIEDSARLDDQAGCVNLPGHDALGLNLHAAFGKNDPIESSRDDHVIAFDLPFHAGTLTEHQGLRRDDRSLHLRFQAERAAKFQGAFQANGFVEKAGPNTGFSGLTSR